MKDHKENRIRDVGHDRQQAVKAWPEWWESLSVGERKLICSLMRMLRGAKQSQLKDVARAAAEWERGIGCFIKVRLMNGYNANGNRKCARKKVLITVQPGDAQKN
jgi:hypothetical protein